MFFNIEGPEGSGKTSLIEEIKRYCSETDSLKDNVVFTKEPGNLKSEACQKIRKLILDPDLEDLDNETKMFLLFADRAEHVSKIVIPALKEGKIVISDRGFFSTISYQGFGEHNGDSSMLCFLESCNDIASQSIIPDVVILLKVSPEIGLNRTTKTEFNKSDSFESKDISFHDRVYKGYEYSYKTYSSQYIQFHVIDTNGKTVEEVNEEGIICFKKYIKEFF